MAIPGSWQNLSRSYQVRAPRPAQLPPTSAFALHVCILDLLHAPVAHDFHVYAHPAGTTTWRAELHQLGSPAFRLLANSTTPMYSASGGQGPSGTEQAPMQVWLGAGGKAQALPGPPPLARRAAPVVQVVEGVFAVTSRMRGRPKVLASRYRDALLQALATAAAKRLGVSLMGGCTRPKPRSHFVPGLQCQVLSQWLPAAPVVSFSLFRSGLCHEWQQRPGTA